MVTITVKLVIATSLVLGKCKAGEYERDHLNYFDIHDRDLKIRNFQKAAARFKLQNLNEGVSSIEKHSSKDCKFLSFLSVFFFKVSTMYAKCRNQNILNASNLHSV